MDPFTLALIAVCAIAALAPRWGAAGGPLHLEQVVTPAISLMFFIHGVALPVDALWQGARNLRLHGLIQVFSYIVFPAAGLLLMTSGSWLLPPDVAIGFFFLSAVSSTISSSVAITGVANGNVTGALFNATLSSMLGVCVTPLYIGFVATTSAFDLNIGTAIGHVALKVLLPIAIGQLARPVLGTYVGQRPRLVGAIDRMSIVIIVYGAACDSILGGAWRHQGIGVLMTIVAVSTGLFYFMIHSTRLAARALGCSRGDEIAAVFCASQKSVGNGLPIAKVMFGASSSLGVIVLPLLVYHQIQLALSVGIARRYNRSDIKKAVSTREG